MSTSSSFCTMSTSSSSCTMGTSTLFLLKTALPSLTSLRISLSFPFFNHSLTLSLTFFSITTPPLISPPPSSLPTPPFSMPLPITFAPFRRNELSYRQDHLISVMSSCCIFPSNRWPDLLPQSELTLATSKSPPTLDLLQPLSLCVAWHAVFSFLFCLPSTPFTPPGQLVVALDSPQSWQTWARHGTRGYYLSPATNYYRCVNVFLSLSCSYRVFQSSPRIQHRTDLKRI